MTPEQRQRKYSQELAEHTLRQWNSVRKGTLGETTERQKGLRKSPPKAVTPPQGEQDESDVKTPMREHNGLQVIDYAKSSAKPVNGEHSQHSQEA